MGALTDYATEAMFDVSNVWANNVDNSKKHWENVNVSLCLDVVGLTNQLLFSGGSFFGKYTKFEKSYYSRQISFFGQNETKNNKCYF